MVTVLHLEPAIIPSEFDMSPVGLRSLAVVIVEAMMRLPKRTFLRIRALAHALEVLVVHPLCL